MNNEIFSLTYLSSPGFFILILVVIVIMIKIRGYKKNQKNKETAKKLDIELKAKFNSVPTKRSRHCVKCKLNLVDTDLFEFFVGNWVFSHSETIYRQVDTSSDSDEHAHYENVKFKVEHFHFSPDAKVLANICQTCLDKYVDREITTAQNQLNEYVASTKKVDTKVKNIFKDFSGFPCAALVAVFLAPLLFFFVREWLHIDLLKDFETFCTGVFCLTIIIVIVVGTSGRMKTQRENINDFEKKISKKSYDKHLIRQMLTKNAVSSLFPDSRSVIEPKESIYKTQETQLGK